MSSHSHYKAFILKIRICGWAQRLNLRPFCSEIYISFCLTCISYHFIALLWWPRQFENLSEWESGLEMRKQEERKVSLSFPVLEASSYPLVLELLMSFGTCLPCWALGTAFCWSLSCPLAVHDLAWSVMQLNLRFVLCALGRPKSFCWGTGHFVTLKHLESGVEERAKGRKTIENHIWGCHILKELGFNSCAVRSG